MLQKLLSTLIAALFVATKVYSAPLYSMQDIGSLGGKTTAWSLNDRGQVTGFSYTTGDIYHAFITEANGLGIRDLGSFGGSVSTGFDINNTGQVIGLSVGQNGSSSSTFLTGSNNEGFVKLGTLGGPYTTGLSVNNSGLATGVSSVAMLGHAFITDVNNQLTDIGTLGGSISRGQGINNSGQVTGYSNTTDARAHAFITGNNGKDIRYLGTLGGLDSYGYAINNIGQVTGYSRMTDNDSAHAFITDTNGYNMIDLGSLGGNSSAG